MTGEFYVMIMGCAVITALTILVVTTVIWYAEIVYDDITERRRLRDTK